MEKVHPDVSGEVVLCGMTVQQSAEAILDHPGTEAVRRACGASYRSCIEELAFAAVLGEGICTGNSLPIVLDGYPGEKLFKTTRLGELRRQADIGERCLAEYFTDTAFRNSVLRDYVSFEQV